MKNKKRYEIFIIVIILSTSFQGMSVEQETTLDLTIVPKEDFKDVLSDSTVFIIDERTGNTYQNTFYKDGTVTSKRDVGKWKGVWFTDKNNQHCIRWSHKDRSNCALIMQDDDGNWAKVKDDEVIKRYKKIDNFPLK